MTMEIYLAGPEVFFPNAREIGAEKKRICARYGLAGLYPLDNDIDASGLAPAQTAGRIFHANCALMDKADGIIANLTPFRGPGADPGTAFEVGYARARSKPVFCYSNHPGTYADHVRAAGLAEGPGRVDRDGLTVEDFGLAENLMLACAAWAGILTPDRALAYDDLSLFEDCVRRVAADLPKA